MTYRNQHCCLLLIFLVLSLHINSQTISIGAKGGISIPNIRGNTEQSEGYTSRRALYFGLMVNRKLSNSFSLQAELNYSPQGGQRNKMQPVPEDRIQGIMLPPGTKLYANFKNKTIINYIELPILLQMHLHDVHPLQYHINLGPYIALLEKARTITSGNSSLYLDSQGKIPLKLDNGYEVPPVNFDSNTSIWNDIKKVGAGLVGGGGLDYYLGYHKVFLEGRFTLGLANIQTDTKANGKNHTGSVIIAAGYAYTFH